VLALTQNCPSFDGAAREYLARGERFGILGLPLHQRYWYYMQDQAEGQPPPTFDFLADRARQWDPIVAETVGATSPADLIPVSIHARNPPLRLGQGRIICIGDAAHAMEPNTGQGACQALEDAAALGAIARHAAVLDILPALEKARLTRVRQISREARISRYIAHGPAIAQFALRSLISILPARIQSNMSRAMHTMPDYR
jgi:2-polyprenyl-6-methoxyphenol hydroxylase-like FAD-dependent oxidoreductase